MKMVMILAVLAACVSPVLAQLSNAGEETQAKCQQHLKTPLPSEAAQITVPKAWPACTSYKLYSGIGTKVDFEAARKCAWSERLAIKAGLEPKSGINQVFGGSAMLTQIYANGEGVERNLPLAIRFACEAEGAPAEIAGRVKYLEDWPGNPKSHARVYNFCDDATSGFMMGFCAAYSAEMANQDRIDTTEKLTRNWTPSQKTAFQLLAAAKEAYAEAHGKGEVDLSGTARAMYQIEERDGIRDNFLEALKSLEKGVLPTASSADAVEADKELNRAYQNSMADAEEHKADYGAVQPGGIRDAERAWLKYRDAWLVFAKVRYPSVSESAWLKLLSDDRVLVLRGKCCGVDPDQSKDAANTPRPLP